jgi:putative Holliday junction resolvase
MPEGPGRPAQPARIILSFDFGRRRIGAARGDTLTRTAAALPGVRSGPQGPDWSQIGQLLGEWRPALIVVGLPYNADGSDSTITAEARRFAQELSDRFATPVEMIDERYSSLDAHARLKDARASGARRRRVDKADIDAAAACVILERWFLQTT